MKLRTAAAGLIVCLLAGIASSQRYVDTRGDSPEAEFHMARVVYRTWGGAGSRGYRQPWWAIDYPMAEAHFLPALDRLTNLSVADDSRHLEVIDDRIFAYPFLFMQQVGQGNWDPNKLEAESLREYLLRAGFWWSMTSTASMTGPCSSPRCGGCCRAGRSSRSRTTTRS